MCKKWLGIRFPSHLKTLRFVFFSVVMKSICDGWSPKLRFGLNEIHRIAAAISSEPCEDFVCAADFIHTEGGFHCICPWQMPYSYSLWGSFPQLLFALFWANFREISLVLLRFSLYSLCSQPVWYCFGINFLKNRRRKISLFFFSKWYLALSYISTGFDVWIQRWM